MSWTTVKLEDIFDIARGGSPRPIADYITDDPDGFNWISIKDASNSNKYIYQTKQKITKEGVPKSRIVNPGDFLLTNSMSFGRPYIMKTTGCIHDGWLVLSKNPDVVDSDYFYYLLSSELMYRKFSSLAAGAVVKNLNIELVKQVEIPLPPLEEQKRIASILDKADAIRRKRQQAIELADQFLRSVFLDMFGDPATNPKGWDIEDLSSLCHKVTDGTHHSPEPQSEGVPYITAKHVKPNRLDFYKKPTFISQEAHEEIFARCAPAKGDVLYIKDGATTGAAAINHYEFQFSMLSSLALIKPQVERLLPEYLCDWLNFPSNKGRIIRNVSGAAITRLTISKIKDIPIELPSILLQQSYAETRKKVLAQVVKLEEGVSSSNRLFHSLSQQAFKGELTQNKAA